MNVKYTGTMVVRTWGATGVIELLGIDSSNNSISSRHLGTYNRDKLLLILLNPDTTWHAPIANDISCRHCNMYISIIKITIKSVDCQEVDSWQTNTGWQYKRLSPDACLLCGPTNKIWLKFRTKNYVNIENISKLGYCETIKIFPENFYI